MLLACISVGFFKFAHDLMRFPQLSGRFELQENNNLLFSLARNI